MVYIFIGKEGKYNIPQGTEVKIIKFYPRRKALVEYQGKKILTMTTLLRTKRGLVYKKDRID